MKWGESLSQLGENELMGMLKYKKIILTILPPIL